MELNAEEVKKVTDKLKLGKFHLLGHSMGGYTSLAFAEKFPDDLKSLTSVSYTHLDVYKRQVISNEVQVIFSKFEFEDSIFNHEENFYHRFSLFTSFLQ